MSFYAIKHILAEFLNEAIRFEQTREYVAKLLFILFVFRPKKKGFLRKKTIEFEGDMLDTLNFYKICVI